MDIEITFAGNKKINAVVNGNLVLTDQSVQSGGEGTAPAPFDLFLASIGTCAGIYVKTFCDMRGISTDGITLVQHMQWDSVSKLFKRIDVEIKIPADFPEKYIRPLILSAEQCTVKRHIQQPPEMKVYISPA
jgi:ribosomal protein S12 methylthiotransferase accessory factor